jgi:hypothetical protein
MTDKQLLEEALDALEYAGCQFFACEGPSKRPVSMKTCRVCWSVRHLRKRLGKVAV